MKKMFLMALAVLVFCMALAACGGEAEPTAAPTVAPTQAPTEPEPTPEPTEPKPRVAETVLPDTDKATGTLKFYFGDKAVYAGCAVADLIDLGVHTYSDLEQVLEPWRFSDVVRLRIEDPDLAEKDRPYLFFVAMNASDVPQKLSECLVYSLTINTDKGIRFGSGKETEAFVTGQTTIDEMLEAYGEPGYDYSRSGYYREIAYFEPFSCAYFSFQNKKVRQINTYYSANVFGDLAQSMDISKANQYFGLDACILMNQYLDMVPHFQTELMEQEAEKEQDTKKDDKEKEAEKPDAVKPLKELDATITLDGQEFELGIRCAELPETFRDPLMDLAIPVHRNYYFRVGRTNEEEFYLINSEGQSDQKAADLLVKGVITQNRNYCNWGEDYSAFHTFSYMGLTQDSTIEQIVEIFGVPQKMDCSSNGRLCYVWMMYEDEAGNTMYIQVDPMVNQISEFRVTRYFEGEREYT